MPVAKTAEIASFLFLGKCSFQTMDIGSIRMAISDIELKIAETSPTALPFTLPVSSGPTNHETPVPNPMAYTTTLVHRLMWMMIRMVREGWKIRK